MRSLLIVSSTIDEMPMTFQHAKNVTRLHQNDDVAAERDAGGRRGIAAVEVFELVWKTKSSNVNPNGDEGEDDGDTLKQ